MMILRGCNSRSSDKIRKEIENFKRACFDMQIKTSLKLEAYFNAICDITKRACCPYRKRNKQKLSESALTGS